MGQPAKTCKDGSAHANNPCCSGKNGGEACQLPFLLWSNLASRASTIVSSGVTISSCSRKISHFFNSLFSPRQEYHNSRLNSFPHYQFSSQNATIVHAIHATTKQLQQNLFHYLAAQASLEVFFVYASHIIRLNSKRWPSCQKMNFFLENKIIVISLYKLENTFEDEKNFLTL